MKTKEGEEARSRLPTLRERSARAGGRINLGTVEGALVEAMHHSATDNVGCGRRGVTLTGFLGGGGGFIISQPIAVQVVH